MSQTRESIYKNAVHNREATDGLVQHNVLVNLMIIDLWVFLKVKGMIKSILKFANPILEILLLMTLGAGLVLICMLSIAQTNNSIFMLRHLRNYNKQSNDLASSFVDHSLSDTTVFKNELDRLKIKIFALDNTLRKMVNQKQECRHAHVGKQIAHEELPDFASEAAGGSVISTPDTETFDDSTRSYYTFFGVPVWKANYFTPRKVIQPWTQAGECWAFRGSRGKIQIELAYAATISHVTMEHIPKSASLTGVIDAAPKIFSVFGEFRDKYIPVDTFEYNMNGPASQIFSIREDIQGIPFKRIMLEVVSNWGNSQYTCIYRFKVHGKLYSVFAKMPQRLYQHDEL